MSKRAADMSIETIPEDVCLGEFGPAIRDIYEEQQERRRAELSEHISTDRLVHEADVAEAEVDQFEAELEAMERKLQGLPPQTYSEVD